MQNRNKERRKIKNIKAEKEAGRKVEQHEEMEDRRGGGGGQNLYIICISKWRTVMETDGKDTQHISLIH